MYGKTEGFCFIGGKIVRTNLLEETLEIMQNHGKSIKDVKFVRCDWKVYDYNLEYYKEYEYYMSWEDFASMANRFYDSSYGGTEVKDNLQIVGKDWWIERHEYDGSEWWEFKSLPTQPEEYKKFSPFKYEEDE